MEIRRILRFELLRENYGRKHQAMIDSLLDSGLDRLSPYEKNMLDELSSGTFPYDEFYKAAFGFSQGLIGPKQVRAYNDPDTMSSGYFILGDPSKGLKDNVYINVDDAQQGIYVDKDFSEFLTNGLHLNQNEKRIFIDTLLIKYAGDGMDRSKYSYNVTKDLLGYKYGNKWLDKMGYKG